MSNALGRRSTALATLGLLTVLVLSGCQPGPPRTLAVSGIAGDKDPVVQVWLGPSTSLHPHHASPHLSAALFPPLVVSDATTHLPAWGQDAPGALMASITSSDLRRWELTIKSGWTWDDGSPVTAADLERGWLAAIADGMPLASTLTDVRARDATTLAFALRAPFAQLPQLLGHATFVPLPPVADRDPATFAAMPLGYGPFRITSRSTDVLELELVPGHPLAPPAAERRLRVALTIEPGAHDDVVVGGDGDILPLAGAADGSRPDLLRVPGRQLAYLGLPLTDPRFADADVRRALSAAIDREALADLLGGAVMPADRLVGPGLARDDDVTCRWCVTDAELARTRWPVHPPPLTVWFAGDGDHEAVIRSIAGDWRTVLEASDIQLASEPADELLRRITSTGVDGPFRLSWQADVAAPVRVIEPLLGPRGSANDVRFRSTALEDLLATAGAERDIAISLKLYGAAEALVLDQVPLIPLWFSTIPIISRPSISGVQVDGEGRLDLTTLEG